ncbi:hypothetical protein CTAYLR_003647 [Chrysophaeum taylorii]|uniref:Peptidyl-prolyl cis-trans isomerase n=1 Tax=Chrysophaeum taylorii TaxID=2483200 RepID=A0AAD7XI12_9STRA|nr:hypothetical protein CTAYLR_003647 [Chrysophaeum taylorii]
MGDVRAAHLLVKHAGSRNPVSRRTNNQIKRSREEALAALAKFRAEIVGADDPIKTFFAIASRHSDCGSYRAGGDLGVFGRGQMQKPFEDATYALEIGEVSDVVSTDSGLHIILRLPVE